jgi:hypothetical protein
LDLIHFIFFFWIRFYNGSGMGARLRVNLGFSLMDGRDGSGADGFIS